MSGLSAKREKTGRRGKERKGEDWETKMNKDSKCWVAMGVKRGYPNIEEKKE